MIKRRGITLLESMVLLAAVLVLASLYPIVRKGTVGTQRANCQYNLRHIGLAIKQYTADSGDYFPSVQGNVKSHGWADSLTPYIKDTQLFQCPSDNTLPARNNAPTSPKYIDYFYNSNLSGVSESALQFIASSVMLGESIPGDARQNSNGGKSDASSYVNRIVNEVGHPIGAANRHLDGANYAFADGHLKWYKGHPTDPNITPAIRVLGCTNPTYAVN